MLREHPDPESLRLSGADFSIVLATPVASLIPNVLAFAFPLDLPAMRREGPLCGLLPILHIILAHACTLERTLRLRLTAERELNTPGAFIGYPGRGAVWEVNTDTQL